MKPKLRFQGFHDDWEEKKLGDIGEISDGDWIEANHIHKTGEYRIIQTGNIGLGKFINKGQKFIQQSDFDELKANEIFKGDLLISRLADPAGRCILSPNLSQRMVTAVDIAIIRPNDTFNSYFLMSYLNTEQNLFKVSNLSTGSTRKRISRKNLETIYISLPSLPEQEKIGAFLSQLDDRIEKQEQKIALLKERKKGWMQQLFSQTIRFKDENGQDYPAWEEKKINDIYNITRGKVLSKKEIQEKGRYPVYSSQTLNHGLLGYYDHYLFENAITWTTDGANAGTVNYREGKFYCTNVCGVLLNDEGYSNQCMSELLNSIAFKHVSRVGNPKLMNNVMSEIIIPVPSLPEQEKIAEFLSKQDELIEKEEEKLELLKQQKKGLLQQMFV